MADAIDQQAQNVGDANPEVASPATETNAEVSSEGQVEAALQSGEELTSEQDRKPSRAERRIREQSSKIRELESQLQQAPQSGMAPWQQPQYADSSEVTVEQVLGAAQMSSETAAEKTRKETRFQLDMRDVQADYPELNPKSDSYDAEFDAAVADLYQQTGGIYGSTRLSDVVAKVHRITTRNEEKAQVQAAKVLSRQANEGALTPTTAATRSDGPSLDGLFQQASRSGRNEDWAAYLSAKRST